MTTSKSLPARPSLESLRKQAKKIARDITAGDAAAVARAREHLPHVDLPCRSAMRRSRSRESTASLDGRISPPKSAGASAMDPSGPRRGASRDYDNDIVV